MKPPLSSRISSKRPNAKPVQIELIYELLDAHDDTARLANLVVEGLMSLPPHHSNPEMMRAFHRQLRELSANLPIPILSMGMSGDFEVAIEEGATHIRVGTALFGIRS